MCAFVELLQSLVILYLFNFLNSSKHSNMRKYHKVVNKITPIYEKGNLPTDMPLWMSFLHKKIQDSSTNENIKL
jgi:hypothetical protein